MKNIKKIAASIGSVLPLIFSPVESLELGNALTITPAIGWQVYHKARELKNGPFYNVSLGINFTPEISLEGTIGHLETRFKNTGQHHHGTHSFLTMLYHFGPDQRFVPYVVGGIGRLCLTQVNGADKRHTTYQGGLGVKFFMNDRVALRTDVRAIVSSARGFRHKDMLINVGLMYQLGQDTYSRRTHVATNAVPAPYEKMPTTQEYRHDRARWHEAVMIQFDYNSAAVKPQYDSKISRVKHYLQDHPNAIVRLEGFADSHGSKEANLRMSKKRVASVSESLQEVGIAKDRIEEIARGFSSDRSGRDAEQRIVIIRIID